MSSLRHSRIETRNNRERIIKKKKKLFDAIWIWGYSGQENNPFPSNLRYHEPPPLGGLAKHSTHHHKCGLCTQRYNRAKEKRKWAENPRGFL